MSKLTPSDKKDLQDIHNKMMGEKSETIVIAKCPSCKKRKEYKMPINYTPYCDKCLFVPMIIDKIKVSNPKLLTNTFKK